MKDSLGGNGFKIRLTIMYMLFPTSIRLTLSFDIPTRPAYFLAWVECSCCINSSIILDISVLSEMRSKHWANTEPSSRT